MNQQEKNADKDADQEKTESLVDLEVASEQADDMTAGRTGVITYSFVSQ